jgi:hypothetical protein
MTEPIDYLFKGTLKIRKLDERKYSFRLYPWTFSNDPSSKDVHEIVFETPELTTEIISNFDGHEVDVCFGDGTISIFDWDYGDEHQFSANSISQSSVGYELSDFVDRVESLEKALEKERLSSTAAHRKLNTLRSLTDELLRRAEIKAESSAEQSKLQKSAIQVIQRLVAELESK